MAESVPLIDTAPDAAVMFTEPITLNVAPPAMLNREEEKKEVWPFSASVQAPKKEREDPRHTSSVEVLKVPPDIRAVKVERETEEENVTADEVDAKRLVAVRLTPLAMLREPPTRAKTLKVSEATAAPLNCAVLAMELTPPTRVRLLTPARVPDSTKDEATLALRGRMVVEPCARAMEEICGVKSSRPAKAQSWGWAGRIVKAALVSAAA